MGSPFITQGTERNRTGVQVAGGFPPLVRRYQASSTMAHVCITELYWLCTEQNFISSTRFFLPISVGSHSLRGALYFSLFVVTTHACTE